MAFETQDGFRLGARRSAGETKMRFSQIAKRTIDVGLATVLIVLLSPIFLVSAFLLLITEGRPIFYLSRRYVSPGCSIPVIKFRSMVRDAKSEKYNLTGRFMRDGYLDIPINCEVYTPVGRWLERLQIVEMPQLINILFHGMSFIGNRPLPGDNLLLLSQFTHWRERFNSPAGISGIAQVVGKLTLSPEERLALEIAYSRLYTSGSVVRCDLYIFAYTLRLIALGRGIPLTKAHEMVGSSLDAIPVSVQASPLEESI